jgi:hypothetical protein
MYNVYITNQFQITFAQGEEGGVKSVVEVIVNSKEENSSDFSPNYDQEFGLRTQATKKSRPRGDRKYETYGFTLSRVSISQLFPMLPDPKLYCSFSQ